MEKVIFILHTLLYTPIKLIFIIKLVYISWKWFKYISINMYKQINNCCVMERENKIWMKIKCLFFIKTKMVTVLSIETYKLLKALNVTKIYRVWQFRSQISWRYHRHDFFASCLYHKFISRNIICPCRFQNHLWSIKAYIATLRVMVIYALLLFSYCFERKSILPSLV